MSKVYLIAYLLFFATYIPAYSQFSLDLILGTRVHTDRMESGNSAGKSKALTSLLAGLNVTYNKLPSFSLSYQKSYVQLFTPYLGTDINAIELFGPIEEKWAEDQVHLYYNLKNFRFGIGHYWRLRENALNFLSPGSFVQKRKGIQISFSVPSKWLEIELRTKVQYDPNFAAIFGTSQYAILFTRRIGKGSKTYNKLEFLSIRGLIGARSFPINIELLPGEKLITPFGIAPSLGLEFLFVKFGISLNIEKDWWNSFNGGSRNRPVKGLIYSSFVGLKYHQKLKNGRKMRYGVGGSWIEDQEAILDNITLNPTPEQQKLGNYQVKGIGLSISYELIPNVDFEIKTTLPLIGEDIFENSSRTSAGLIYRYNPSRKKN